MYIDIACLSRATGSPSRPTERICVEETNHNNKHITTTATTTTTTTNNNNDNNVIQTYIRIFKLADRRDMRNPHRREHKGPELGLQ